MAAGVGVREAHPYRRADHLHVLRALPGPGLVDQWPVLHEGRGMPVAPTGDGDGLHVRPRWAPGIGVAAAPLPRPGPWQENVPLPGPDRRGNRRAVCWRPLHEIHMGEVPQAVADGPTDVRLFQLAPGAVPAQAGNLPPHVRIGFHPREEVARAGRRSLRRVARQRPGGTRLGQ